MLSRNRAIAAAVFLFLHAAASAQDKKPKLGNRADRLEWFQDAGFGLFITWSLDSQLGAVISHSLIGSSEEYARAFYQLLPRTFNPVRFNPREWATLARYAGFKYVVFTAKHHSGYCMFNTRTTDFNIMQSPYGKDIAAEVLQAFRAEGIAPGLYFSPDDFHYLREHGKVLARYYPGVTPQEDPGLMEYDRSQLRELLTGYGNVDVLFMDGAGGALRELAWELQPQVVVTRGAMPSMEERLPEYPPERGAWEICMPMGTAWQYRPGEVNKPAGDLIRMLIAIRSKGGNFLLNIGPRPDGQLIVEQEDRLRELALWNFINGESVFAVRPWVVSNEGDIWFTKKKDADTVYVFLPGPWRGSEDPHRFTLKSVQGTPRTAVSVLGQSDKVGPRDAPYNGPKPEWREDSEGFQVTMKWTRRLYEDRSWKFPVVLKLENVKPSSKPTAAGKK